MKISRKLLAGLVVGLSAALALGAGSIALADSSPVALSNTSPDQVAYTPEAAASTAPVWHAQAEFVPSGLSRRADTSETVNGLAVGTTAVFLDSAYDPGPSGKVIWLRVQETDSGLKPVWAGKGSWLPAPVSEEQTINGRGVVVERNACSGTFEGKPFTQLWVKAAWQVDGVEYQVLSINVSLEDFLRFAESVNLK